MFLTQLVGTFISAHQVTSSNAICQMCDLLFFSLSKCCTFLSMEVEPVDFRLVLDCPEVRLFLAELKVNKLKKQKHFYC